MNSLSLPNPERNPFLERALDYALQDWHVFPLAPGTKDPFAKSHGFKDATTDPDIIRGWWKEHPNANVAIATGRTSGIWVLDADTYKNPDCLKDLEKTHGKLPQTRTIATARGGRHFYFVMPSEVGIRSGNDKLGGGLDIKADGGYIVAPPSVFEGGAYKLLNAAPPALPPQWLLDLLTLQRNSGNRETEAVSVSPSLCLSVNSIEKAVMLSLPTSEHQNDRCLLTLARALMVGFTLVQKLAAFDLWYEQAGARGLLREGESRDHYLTKFLHAVKSAKYPLGQGPADHAWALACSEPFPPEAALFETVEGKRVIGFCFQLDLLAKGEPWPLACRTLARLTGMAHTTAATWLSALVEAGILTVKQANTKTAATRYGYNKTKRK